MQELSVIMTTYNENPDFLKTCINSVLQQTYKNYEFIIVSEPDEMNIDYMRNIENRDRRIKILRNTVKLGVAESRNIAIRESSCEYIALIDGDDYCELRRFEKQIRVLKDNPELSVVGSNMYLIDEKNNIIGERKYPESFHDIKRHFLLTMSVGNPTVMTRKKDLAEVGYFDSTFSKAEDFELWLRFLVKNKKIYNLQENLLYYRVSMKNKIKRSKLHWRNNYIARKRYSRFIWPFHKRACSLFAYFFISKIPERFLDWLLNLKITNRIRKISVNWAPCDE